jgi:hypothetical protein
MSRKVEETEPFEVGVDVARYGNDKTVMYLRKGAKVIAQEVYTKRDTIFVANAAWDLAGRDNKVPIKIDDGGVGGGCTDYLRQLGANVVPINFGGVPRDKQKFTSTADEMWFTLPIDDIQIPDDPQLMEELAGRRYFYDKLGRRKIETKDDFKKRYGRSPDKADALLLTFYSCYHRGSSVGSVPIVY